MASVPLVGPTELIRSSWGNLVANELNTRAVKVDGSLPMTGSLVINANPPLKLRQSGNLPAINFESTAAAILGSIQGSAAEMKYTSVSASGFHQFVVGATERLRAHSTGATVTGNLSVTGTATVNGILYGTQPRFGGNGSQLSLIDTVGGGHNTYMGFFGNGTTATPGTRDGLLGYTGDTTLRITNEVAGGHMVLATAGAGDIQISPTSEIWFRPNATLQGVMSGNVFMWGKGASDLTNAGVEMFGAGSGAEGSIRNTTGVAGIQNWYARHAGAADANDQYYATFVRTGGATIGAIRQNGTTGVTFETASDMRLKTDLGLITEATERFKLLQPRRFSFTADTTGTVQDGFFAQEVAKVIPEAVSGDPDGDPDTDPMGMDYGRITPLMAATLLETIARVEKLEAA